ncbi:MAG TPA: carbohydrate-binding protein, partial [Verrucomicrobiae bacterium]
MAFYLKIRTALTGIRSISPGFWRLIPGLLVVTQTIAANNPLSSIPATSYSQVQGSVTLESAADGTKNLANIRDGDYAVFRGYDFDSGVAGFTARLASVREGTIDIRLDRPDGVRLGVCSFGQTGGWDAWTQVSCPVDNSQAGVRDIYLVFHGKSRKALVNVQSFQFLKSLALPVNAPAPALAERVDAVDAQPQANHSWGMPEQGWRDDFSNGQMTNWITSGLVSRKIGAGPDGCLASPDGRLNIAVAPRVYINKTDTGGEWRELAEASLTVDLTLDEMTARPGAGFATLDGQQWIQVALNAEANAVEVWRKFKTGEAVRVKNAVRSTNASAGFTTNVSYQLKLDWSPYANALMVFLHDPAGQELANFRTVIDLPAARHPLLMSTGGPAHFAHVIFDPTVDGWNFKWQWKKSPVLTPDVCNPAVWRSPSGKFYMMWRKFGQDTYHGIAASADGINWTRVSDKVLKCTGDMNVLVDPFGDGLTYVTPGGNKMAWYASDGSADYTEWKDTGKNLGDIFGNSRIQEIIDTKQHPHLAAVHFQDKTYRFI